MFDLTGKRALVTGASGGIGAAIARRLHAAGAEVALSGTRKAVLESLAGELGERTVALAADLAQPEAAAGLAGAAREAMGGVDILVNNAGITRDSLAVRMRDEDWQRVIELDLTVAFRLTRALLRDMMRARKGRIVNIGSVVGATGNAGQANYAAAKAGLTGLTKALAAEVAGRGITVNCVAPGFIETPMTEALGEDPRERLRAAIPMGRFGLPDDVAGAVVYLASDEAAYVTGHTLHVNGGLAMI